MGSDDPISAAAEAVGRARAILVTAGAGMGVDSGLPDFRGDRGFWNAYPPYESRGLHFTDLANPHWFRRDQPFAWGFYGHRLNLYRAATPHPGFSLLLRWTARCELGSFVVTSNVDGQFQKAEFPEDRIVEIHGSIHHLQCSAGCGVGILDGSETQVHVDEQTMRAGEPLPACPRCGCALRPNILMFGDHEWDSSRSDRQSERYHRWLGYLRRELSEGGELAVIECGAGTALPAVRTESERRVREFRGTLIRINRYDPEVPGTTSGPSGIRWIGLRGGALDLLREINRRLPAADTQS
ncbi:SIR2 family NAD-dependent protein deacylase [Salinispira pacifica]